MNKHTKNKGWNLCGDYLEYRSNGGNLSPDAWNTRIKEMNKERKESFKTELKNLGYLDDSQIKQILSNPENIRMFDDLEIGNLQRENEVSDIIEKYLT